MPEGLAILVVIAVLVYGRKWIAPLLGGTSLSELVQARREIKREDNDSFLITPEIRQLKDEIDETAEKEKELEAWCLRRAEALDKAGQAFLDFHLALRSDGAGARLRLVLLTDLPFDEVPRGFWFHTLDTPLRVYDKFGTQKARIEELVADAMERVARQLGIRHPVMEKSSGQCLLLDPTPSPSVPDLPGFPWDGSAAPSYDEAVIAKYRAQLNDRFPAVKAKKESVEARLRDFAKRVEAAERQLGQSRN